MFSRAGISLRRGTYVYRVLYYLRHFSLINNMVLTFELSKIQQGYKVIIKTSGSKEIIMKVEKVIKTGLKKRG